MPLFIKVAIFSDVYLVSNYHDYIGEALKLVSYCMIDFIYKTVYPSHLRELQIVQNIKILIFEVILIFSDWILVKETVIFSTLFCLWGKHIFDRTLPREISNSLLPIERDDKNLGASLDWDRAWVKTSRLNEELCLMSLKSDGKFGEKLICCFKSDKNLVNFDRSTRNS